MPRPVRGRDRLGALPSRILPLSIGLLATSTNRILPLSIGLLASFVVAAPRAFAHGGPDLPAPDLSSALTTWSTEPLPWLTVVVGLVGYLTLVRLVDRAHPRSRVPRWRIAAWLAGLVALAVALGSTLDVYATTLFSVHMVQHLLLAMVVPPLLALGAPVTLLLRASSRDVRRRFLLPILHSRPVRVLAHPIVAWLTFTAVMWISHFSPLFDAALEDEGVHAVEHALFLGAGFLFWWPIVAADPVPWRMGFGARLVYLGLSMPQNTFLGLALYSAESPLYRHYATLERTWGPDPLADQQLAGGLMWAIGDFLFIIPLVLLVAAWLQAEEAEGRRVDARLDRERRADAPPGA